MSQAAQWYLIFPMKLHAVLMEFASILLARRTELVQLQHCNTGELSGERLLHRGSVHSVLPSIQGHVSQRSSQDPCCIAQCALWFSSYRWWPPLSICGS